MVLKRIPKIGERVGDGKPTVLRAEITYSAGSFSTSRTCWVVLTAVGGGAGGGYDGTGGAGGAAAMRVFKLFKGQAFSWVVGAGGGAGSSGQDTVITLPGGSTVVAGRGVFGAGSTAVGGDINRSGGGSNEDGANGGAKGSGGGGYYGGGGAAGFADFGTVFTALNLNGSFGFSYTYGKGGNASDHGDGTSGLIPGAGGGASPSSPGNGCYGEVRYIALAV